MRKASEYVAEGYSVVVDMDLEKFFDRVNHDVLMGRLARRIADKRLLRIVRQFLEAGIMRQGVVVERSEGTPPQGGPLSPLLANRFLSSWVTYFRYASVKDAPRADGRVDPAEAALCAAEETTTGPVDALRSWSAWGSRPGGRASWAVAVVAGGGWSGARRRTKP